MKAYRIRIERYCTYLKSPVLLRHQMLATNPAIGDVVVKSAPCNLVALRQMLAEPKDKKSERGGLRAKLRGRQRKARSAERSR